MILVQRSFDDIGLSTYELLEYNEDIVNKSKELFNELKSSGIMYNCEFDNSYWSINNGYKKVGLKFDFNEVLYTKEFENRLMYSYSEFVNCVKSYIILRFNEKTAETFATCLNRLKDIMNDTRFLNKDLASKRLDSITITESNSSVTILSVIYDFLKFIEFDTVEFYRDLFLDDLEGAKSISRKYVQSNNQRRDLTDFQSMFLFDKSIDVFWSTVATDIEKLYYYPLYLWWKITNILPLRVKEFLLTPINCITPNNDGTYSISVRRSGIKGGRTKSVSHSVNGDFKICTYRINKGLAEHIENYKALSSQYRADREQDYLISFNTFIECGNAAPQIKEYLKNSSCMFTSSSLENMMTQFYINVLQNKLNLYIVSDKEPQDNNDVDPLAGNQIKEINLGDTRHFAMINMILNDFSPLLVKDFAGHSDVDMSYHYFGNISEIVKCISYMKYKELTNFNTENMIVSRNVGITGDMIMASLEREDVDGVEVDEGLCFSKKFKVGNIEDCQKVGSCRLCKHLNRTIRETKEERKRYLKQKEDEIRREGELLGEILSSYKDNVKCEKDLKESMLKIQSKSTQYLKDIELNGGYYE